MKFFLTICVLVMSLALRAEVIPLWGSDVGGSYHWEYSVSQNNVYVVMYGAGIFYYPIHLLMNGQPYRDNNCDFSGYLNGTLTFYMDGGSNYCTYLNVSVCPNTPYCQPSSCGAGCSVHGSDGGLNCVQTTCSTCGTTYCTTHQKHKCTKWTCCKGVVHLLKSTVMTAQAFPDFSTLGSNKTCSACSEIYCTICGHACNGAVNTTPGTDELAATNQLLQNQAAQMQAMANNTLSMLNYLQSINELTQGNSEKLSSFETSFLGLKDYLHEVLDKIEVNTRVLNDNFMTYMLEFEAKTDQIINTTAAINTTLSNIDSSVTVVTQQLDGLLLNTDDMLDLMDDQIKAIEELTAQFKTNDTLPGKRDMITLQDNSSVFDTLKSKLLPSFSLFTISGCEWPEWQIVIPVSTVAPGLSDFTMVVGGQSWTTVAGGFIPKIAHISRSLSYLVFTFMFIFAVVRALRQW